MMKAIKVIQYSTTSIVVLLFAFFSIVITLCDSKYFNHSPTNPLNPLCIPIYDTLFGEYTHKGFPMWPSASLLFLTLIVCPILIIAFPQSVAPSSFLLPKKRRKQQQQQQRSIDNNIDFLHKVRIMLTKGDPSIRFYSILFLVLPFWGVLYSMASKGSVSIRKDGIAEFMITWAKRVANPTGYLSAIALSFFMVPVAKQSPLLAALGWSPIQALGFHIWAGRVSFTMMAIHGFIYFTEMPTQMMPEIGNPEKHCWTLPSSLFDYRTEENPNDHCYRQWRNFAGCISGVAFAALMVTSLNRIRRWNYRFFYVSHILFGCCMLLFAIFHFYWIALYIVPGLLYYLACSIPVVVQQLANYQLDGGVLLQEYRLLSKSTGCMELVFSKKKMNNNNNNNTITTTGDANKNINTNVVASPAYVRICVPEISLMWHPFTIPHDPNHDDNDNDSSTLRLLIRREGYFTKQLYHRLKKHSQQQQEQHNQIQNNNDESKKKSHFVTEKQNNSLPRILVDGFYPGPNWLGSALQHDTVLLVSGGIGVTPMLTILEQLLIHTNVNCAHNNGCHFKTKLVAFHWFCRDEGLIRHALLHYILPLLSKIKNCNNDDDHVGTIEKKKYSNEEQSDDDEMIQMEDDSIKCHFKILIHFTAREVDDTTPFVLTNTDTICDDEFNNINGMTTNNDEEEKKDEYDSFVSTVDKNNNMKYNHDTFVDEPLSSKQNKKLVRFHSSVQSTIDDDDTDPSADIYVDLANRNSTGTKQVGVPLKSASFTHMRASSLLVSLPKLLRRRCSNKNSSSNTASANCVSCTSTNIVTILGLLSFLGGYGVYLYWYYYEVRERTERIFFRGYSMYVILFSLIGSAMLMEFVQRRSSRYNNGNRNNNNNKLLQPLEMLDIEMMDIEEDSQNNNENDNSTNKQQQQQQRQQQQRQQEKNELLSSITLPYNGRSYGTNNNNNVDDDDDGISFHLDVTNGRPIISDIIHPVVEAEAPGGFYCGPTRLLSNVQNAIKSERAARKGSYFPIAASAPPCCIYQEHFEM